MSRKNNKNRRKKGKKTGRWKIILLIFLAVTLIGTIIAYSLNLTVVETVYPEPTDYFYVEDYSHVLNEKTESYILDEAVRLNEATKAQVVVVTVPNTPSDALYDFSVQIANKWGIGDKELDNGVLLLFVTDPEDPHIRMEVGKGLEGAIPDGKAGRILDDYAVGPRDAGQWNKAAGDSFVAVLKEVYGEYGIPVPETVDPQEWEEPDSPTEGTFADADFPEPVEKENDAPFLEQIVIAFLISLLFSVILAVIVVIAFVATFFGGSRDDRSGFGGSFSGGGSSFGGGGGSFGGGGASR